MAQDKERRGFASMDIEKRRKIASAGGRAAHEHGTGHEWTSAEAREAGRKGGLASHRRKVKTAPVDVVHTDAHEDHHVSRFLDEGNPNADPD